MATCREWKGGANNAREKENESYSFRFILWHLVGGFALAARWAGVETIGFAEIDDYASRVLAKNFPGVANYGDVRNVPGELSAWLVTGGFPCQPFSVAGKQRGKADDRWLWPEMAGVIECIRPRWVLGENVPGIIRMELDTVLSDLERLDYTAWPIVIPAVGVDAPHRRERVWIVAYTDEGDSGRRSIQPQREAQGRTAADGHGENVAYTDSRRLGQRHAPEQTIPEFNKNGNVSDANNSGRTQQRRTIAVQPQHAAIECGSRWQPEPELGRVAHGIPARVDRLRGLGNAIVPQVAYQLIKMMIEIGDGE
jgi:DNA (cytosine-5)-methyltransferase 1